MSWSLPPAASLRPFLVPFSASYQRHQHRSEREFASGGFSGEFAQVPAGARNRRAPLQDRRDDDRGGQFAHCDLRRLPGAGADSEHRADDRRDAKEIAPVRNTALGVVGNVRAGLEDHSKRIGLLWRSRGSRWWLRVRPRAFSEAWFKFNRVVWV